MIKSLHKNLLAASLLAGIGLSAVAQTPAPATVAAPQAQAQAQAHPHRGDPARMEQRHARQQQMHQVQAERRLAGLKLKLHISSAQEGAWNAWTNAIKPTQRPRMDRAAFASLTTPERLDRMQALRTERNARMDQRAAATKTFYAALSADQQKVFDGESLRFGKRGHRGNGGHPGHHHRG